MAKIALLGGKLKVKRPGYSISYPNYLEISATGTGAAPITSNLFPDSNFTLEVCMYVQGFFNPTGMSDSENTQQIGLWQGVSQNLYPCFIRFRANGSIEFQNYLAGAAANIFTGKGLVKPGRWFHLAAVHDYTNRTLYYYINGSPVFQGELTASPLRDTRGFALGVVDSARGVNNFIGNFDEIRMWRVARTAAQIAANWNRPNAALLADGQITAAACAGCWSFDTPNTNIFLDGSGNNLHMGSTFGTLMRAQQGPADFLTGYPTTPTTLSLVP
jgi:hypothetical protein